LDWLAAVGNSQRKGTVMVNSTEVNNVNRALGQVQGEILALKNVLDEIRSDLHDIKADVAELKMKEGQRSVIEKAAVWMAGVLGAVITMIVGHFWK